MSSADEFTKHLARVRDRFAAALDDKISESFAAIEMPGNNAATPAVITAHRRLHEICGIAPTLGFPATGKAARAAEAVLRDAARTKRALKTDEMTSLRMELEALRAAARGELRAYAATDKAS